MAVEKSAQPKETGILEKTTTEEDYRIVACRRIVANSQYEKIDGVLMDLFTASAVIKVYDTICDQNKELFLSVRLDEMVAMTWAVLKK